MLGADQSMLIGRKNSGAGLYLTEHEAEVLKLVALGFTNRKIARQLDVGIKSMETYKACGGAGAQNSGRVRWLCVRSRMAGRGLTR